MGLVIFGSSIVALFWSIWYLAVILPSYSWSPYELSPYVASQWKNFTPMIFGAIVFMLIGLFMMKSGIRERETTD